MREKLRNLGTGLQAGPHRRQSDYDGGPGQHSHGPPPRDRPQRDYGTQHRRRRRCINEPRTSSSGLGATATVETCDFNFQPFARVAPNYLRLQKEGRVKMKDNT